MDFGEEVYEYEDNDLADLGSVGRPYQRRPRRTKIADEDDVYVDDGEDGEFNDQDEDEDYEYDDDEDRHDDDASYSSADDGEYYDEEEEEGEKNEMEDEQTRAQRELDDEAMANAIMTSVEGALGPIASTTATQQPRKTIKMTDLGLHISQMVIMKNRGGADDQVNANRDLSSLHEVEEVEEGEDVLLERTLSGRRRQKTGVRGRPKKVDFGFGRSTTIKLAPETAKLMGQANMAFVQRHYDDAIAALLEVIRQSPSSHEPYHTLGLVYEEKGELGRAFGYFLLSAHLIKGDLELWNKLTQLAIKLGRRREALYCLSRVLRMGRIADPEPYWVRSRLYLELDSYRSVVWSFLELLQRRASAIEIWQAVARLALKINLAYEAAALFGRLFTEAFATTRSRSRIRPGDVTWSHLNLQLEMFLSCKNYEGAIGAAEQFAPSIWAQSQRTMAADALLAGPPSLESILHQVPLDIHAKLAMAYIGLGSGATLPLGLDNLGSELDVESFGDLRVTLGDAFAGAKLHEKALLCYIPLLESPQFGNAELCLKIGKAHAELGNWEDATGVLSVGCQLDPESLPLRVALAETYKAMGQPDLATRILGAVDTDAEMKPADVPVDLDPASIYSAVQGDSADISRLYGISWGSEDDPSSVAMDIEAGVGSLLRLPNIMSKRPHPALRRIRRRPRKQAHTLFTPAQIEAAHTDYRRCCLYYAQAIAEDGTVDPDAAENFLQVSSGLIDDLLTNTHLCHDEKFRGIAPQIRADLSALHGLTVEEWYDLVEMHSIVLVKAAGLTDRALRTVRRLCHQSVYSFEEGFLARIRLLLVSLSFWAGRGVGAIVASRWFIVQKPSAPGALLLFGLVAQSSGLEVIEHQANHRPLLRSGRIHPHNLSIMLQSANMAFARAYYDESIRLYSALHAAVTDPVCRARIRVYLAVSLVEASFKRTCVQPRLNVTKALLLMAENNRSGILGAEGRYNFARICHELGILAKAEPLYRALLEKYAEDESALQFVHSSAYNLHLIYLAAGNHRLARDILHRYGSMAFTRDEKYAALQRNPFALVPLTSARELIVPTIKVTRERFIEEVAEVIMVLSPRVLQTRDIVIALEDQPPVLLERNLRQFLCGLPVLGQMRAFQKLTGIHRLPCPFLV